MLCSACHDTGWVCEDHPNQSMHHADASSIGVCSSAGRPCQDSRCYVPKNPPPLPPGWTSLANVGDVPQGMSQVKWKGKQVPLAQCWEFNQGRPGGDLSAA